LAISPILPLPSAASAGPAHLTTAQADSIKAAIIKDRKDTEERLRSKPTSYLATIMRRDFGAATTLTVGGAADNDVRIDDPGVLAHHLRVVADGRRRRSQRADDRDGDTGGAARRVDGQVRRVAHALDASAVLAPLGQSLFPQRRLLHRVLVGRHAFPPRIVLVDPRTKVARRQRREREHQVAEIALGIDGDDRHVHQPRDNTGQGPFHSGDSHSYDLYWIAVDKRFQGRGFGRQILGT
jgi:GNAT superfamily N-acetyltransferase